MQIKFEFMQSLVSPTSSNVNRRRLEDRTEAFRIVLLCSLWYSISSTNSVIGKKILTDFPFPLTVAMVQVVSTALFLSPTLRVWNVPAMKSLPKSSLLKLILPLSFGKAFAAITAHVSIWRVPVSYSHTGRLISKTSSS